MRHQIIEITNQYPFMPSDSVAAERAEVMDCLYWINIFPPMEADNNDPLVGARQVCPWALSAEFANTAITLERKKHVLESLRMAKRTMNQFGLPANRVMFMQDNQTHKISVWID